MVAQVDQLEGWSLMSAYRQRLPAKFKTFVQICMEQVLFHENLLLYIPIMYNKVYSFHICAFTW